MAARAAPTAAWRARLQHGRVGIRSAASKSNSALEIKAAAQDGEIRQIQPQIRPDLVWQRLPSDTVRYARYGGDYTKATKFRDI